MLPIAVDAMGGDHGPSVTVPGAGIAAARHPGVPLILAGGLTAINFEIANSAYLGAAQSGTVLFATYIGGVGFFIGPLKAIRRA